MSVTLACVARDKTAKDPPPRTARAVVCVIHSDCRSALALLAAAVDKYLLAGLGVRRSEVDEGLPRQHDFFLIDVDVGVVLLALAAARRTARLIAARFVRRIA